MTPFDFVKDLTGAREDLFAADTEQFYAPFIINRALALQDAGLFHANQMNLNHHLPKEMQHDYYLRALRGNMRSKQWIWKKSKNEVVQLIQQIYKYNHAKATAAAEILTEAQIAHLNKQQQRGGVG
jgi:hypothetical protein